MTRRLRIATALLLGLAVSAGAQFVSNPPSLSTGAAQTWTAAQTFSTSITVGSATPTPMTNIRVYSASCTPTASSAAIQTHVFACTVTGVTTADKIIVNGPASTSLCPLVTARVSGADTVSLEFAVLTAAACTPSAGTYLVVAFRS